MSKSTNQQNAKSTNQQNPLVKKCMETLKPLPMVQTKHLNKLFGFNDGGKYMRRHLRKHYQSEHEWGNNWVWKPNDKQLIEIVEYFVDNQQIFDETKRQTVSSLIPNHKIDDVKF